MGNKINSNDRLKQIGFIFFVVLCGFLLLILGLTYIIRDPLELSSCELCKKINPWVAECSQDFKPFVPAEEIRIKEIINYGFGYGYK